MHSSVTEIQHHLRYLYERVRIARRGRWFRSVYPAPHRYTIAILSVAIEVLLKTGIEQIIGFSLQPFLFASTAVMVSAWYGGIGPGLLSTILSGFMIDSFFMTSPGTLGGNNFHHNVQIAAFVLEGVTIGVLSEALRAARMESERMNVRMRHILESIADAFCTVDNTWRFTYLNTQAQRLFHHSTEHAIGKTLWEITPVAIGRTYKKQFVRAAKDRVPFDVEVYDKPSDRWLHLHAFPYDDGVSLYIHDITGRKTEERNKDAFISVASHELKTPLTSLTLYGQLLARRISQGGATDPTVYVEKMNEQISRLVKLVENLLEMSRIHLGRFSCDIQPLDLGALLRDVIDDCARSIPSHRVVSLIPPIGLVKGDRERIRQVLINLITNAAKYSPDAKTIDIRVAEENDMIAIHVRDYGIGISPEEQKKILLPYYQAKQLAGVSNAFSLGLGLTITSEIIRQHGGTLRIYSVLGKGSTFTVTLEKYEVRLLPDGHIGQSTVQSAPV